MVDGTHGSRRHRQGRRPQVSVRVSRSADRRAEARSRSRSKARPGSEVDALERRRRGSSRAGRSRACSLAPGRVGARACAHAGLGDLFDGCSTTCCPLSRRRSAGHSRSRSWSRTPAAGRSIRGRSASRSATLLQLLADGRARRGDRRSPVARRLVGERARVRASAAAGDEHRCCSGRGGSTRASRHLPSRPPSTPTGSTAFESGPLSVGATHQLLRARLSRSGVTSHAPQAARGIGWQSVLRARARRAPPSARTALLADPTQPLPVPERLEELVSTRLDGFTGATREALVLASAHGRLTGHRARSRGDRARRSRAGARRTGRRGGAWKRAVHAPAAGVGPLPGAACQPSGSARTARSPISSTIRSPALVTSRSRPTRADAELACELEAAGGTTAAAQGAPIAAAELGEHAIRLTPAGDRVDARPAHRSCHACPRSSTGGDRARPHAPSELLAVAAPGPARAEALALAAEVEGDYIGRSDRAPARGARGAGAPAASAPRCTGSSP